MGQALLKSDLNYDEGLQGWKAEQGWKVINFELERRLKKLALTMEEYKRRVSIKLRWYKVWVTSDAEVDLLLAQAPKDILDELEWLWEESDGKWQGWKIQNGESMDKIRTYVLSILDEE